MVKNWVFDLQRFANSDTISLSSSTGTYYYLVDNTNTAATKLSSTTAITDEKKLTAGANYLKIKVDGSTVTAGVVTQGALTTYVTSAFDQLHVKLASSSTTFSLSTTTATALYLSADNGKTITCGGKTYYVSANGTEINFGAGTGAVVAASVELKSGAVALGDSYTGIIKTTGTGGDVVGVETGTTANVTWDGVVSGLAKDEVVYLGTTGTKANTDASYTVGAYGENIVHQTDATDATTAATYVLTKDISQVTITSTNTLTDTISNSVKTTALGETIGANGVAAVSILGAESDTSNKVYAYFKGGNVIWTGRQSNSEFGQYLGTVGFDGTVYSYDGSTSTQTQEITGGGTNKITKVLTGSGNDKIDYSADPKKAVTLSGGAGNDEIKVLAYADSSIVGGAGNDSITFAAANGTVASGVFVDGGDGKNEIKRDTGVTNLGTASNWTVKGGKDADVIDFSGITTAGSEWSIDGGDGNNDIKVGTGITFSTVKAGSGNDTIFSAAANNTITGGAGKDVFDIATAGAAANIADYTYGSDSILVNDASIANAKTVTATGGLSTDGVLDYSKVTTAGTSGQATVTASGGFYAVTLVDNTASKNKVDLGWVKDEATTINASSLTNKAVLVGTVNGTDGDLLVGGSKDDVLYAGANDSIYGGAGKDELVIANNTGVYVGVGTSSGADTATGFVAGFDIDSADAVYLVDGNIADMTVSDDGTSGNVTVKSGKGTLDLQNVTTDGTTGAVKLLVNGKKVYSVADGKTVSVASADDIADYFYGSKDSGIYLGDYEDDISVDLSNAMFKNIVSVTGGKANTTIMGSKAAETLYGGTGTTSLYGGAGKDSLVSGTGVTTFFLTNGAGKDSVSGFVTGTDESTSDVLNIFNAGLTGITRSSGSSFTLKVSDTDSLTVNQASGDYNDKIQWVSGSAKGVAKIGYSSQANTFAYDSEVTNYLGGSKSDTVTFSGSEDVNVWLENNGTYSSIEVLDASGSTGDATLAGSAASETLRGSNGNASLWGGVGNAKDVLISNSSSTTTFFYGMGQGSDSISGGTNDTVNLYDMQLSDLASANIDTSGRRVIFTTTAGDTVTVSGGVQNFTVGGTTYQTSYASNTDWTAKA